MITDRPDRAYDERGLRTFFFFLVVSFLGIFPELDASANDGDSTRAHVLTLFRGGTRRKFRLSNTSCEARVSPVMDALPVQKMHRVLVAYTIRRKKLL